MPLTADLNASATLLSLLCSEPMKDDRTGVAGGVFPTAVTPTI